MGRKKIIKQAGVVDWQIRILSMPEKQIGVIRAIVGLQNKKLGDILRQWILSQADIEAKRLKLPID